MKNQSREGKEHRNEPDPTDVYYTKQYNEQYRTKKNPDYQKKWIRLHLNYKKEWRLRHKDEIRQYQREWLKNNTDHVRAYKGYNN